LTIKLIAIDIDDTLLDSNGKILESSIRAIRDSIKSGIKVVLCSGRPFAGIKSYLNMLEISGNNQYVVAYNGAIIKSASGKTIAENLLDNYQYRKLTEFGKKHNISFNVLDNNSIIYTANHNVNRFTVLQAWENHAGLLIREPDELPSNFMIAKGLFIGEDEQLNIIEEKVFQSFGSNLYVVRSANNFLEVMHKNVNKGNAIEILAKTLKIQASEVMAIGDEKNDIPMFNFAGTAIAMGNASELVKNHANYIADDNDSGGIAESIAKFAL